MPFDYTIHERLGIAILRAKGRVTGEDAERAFRDLVSDSAWVPTYHMFWDLREITALLVEPPAFRAFHEAVSELTDRVGPGRSAMLPRRDLDRTMAEVYTAVVNRLKTRNLEREAKVCTSLREAAEWLGVPADELEHITRNEF